MTLKSILHHLNLRSTRLFPRLKPLSKFILIFTFVFGSILTISKIRAIDIDIKEGYSGGTELKIDQTGFINDYLEKQEAIKSGNNQESWIEESLMSNTVSLNKAISGEATKDTFTTGWIPGGMIGTTNHYIASLYNPPISGTQYIANSINNFLGKPIYAANGFGFNQLSRVQDLWKTLRNAVYTLISLFFIILGIMIMLRIKTSPQTTISIQTAIPKIVTTLILVTFSFAIAGLIIDLSYLVEGLILSIIMDNKTDLVAKTMQLNYQGLRSLIGNNLLPPSIGHQLGTLIGSAIGGATGAGWFAEFIGGLAGALIFLLMNLYVFILFVKLFFGLAFCYVKIIIKIIVAPLEIGLGVFPGSKTGFTSWLFDLIANISVFPAVTIFLVVASWLVPTLTNETNNSAMWSPNLLGSGTVVGGLIGMVSILLMSKIPTIVPEAIFKIKPSPYGKDLGKDFSKTPGFGLARSIGSTAKVGIIGGVTKNIGERVRFMRRDQNPIQANENRKPTRFKINKEQLDKARGDS